MDDKTLNVADMVDLVSKVPDVEVVGDPGAWEVVCKVSSRGQGWMKTTKRIWVGEGNGFIYQMETQQKNIDGSYSLSQSSVFVPDARNGAE